jgi:hypothetical protein
MPTSQRHESRILRLRAARERVRLGQILSDAAVRLFRFPVATVTGIFTAFAASRLIRSFPLNSLLDVFLWLFLGTSLGFLIAACLVALAALENTRLEDRSSAELWKVARDLVAAAAIAGLALSIPVIAVLSLALPTAQAHAMALAPLLPWAEVSVLGLGALLPVAAWLPAAIAWPLTVRHGIPFGLAVGFVLSYVDGTLYQRTPLAFSIVAVGCTAAFVPWLCLLVVPWVMHVSICLRSSTVERN